MLRLLLHCMNLCLHLQRRSPPLSHQIILYYPNCCLTCQSSFHQSKIHSCCFQTPSQLFPGLSGIHTTLKYKIQVSIQPQRLRIQNSSILTTLEYKIQISIQKHPYNLENQIQAFIQPQNTKFKNPYNLRKKNSSIHTTLEYKIQISIQKHPYKLPKPSTQTTLENKIQEPIHPQNTKKRLIFNSKY